MASRERIVKYLVNSADGKKIGVTANGCHVCPRCEKVPAWWNPRGCSECGYFLENLLSIKEAELQGLIKEFLKGDCEARKIVLGDILHVCRPTIEKWLKGENLPYRLVTPRIIKVLRKHLNKPPT